MSLWYAQSGPRSRDTGKFRSHARIGTEKSSGGGHRGWSYHLVCHQTGASVRRVNYCVSITDPNGNRAEYLRGFSSAEKAGAAARDWIDALLNKMQRTKSSDRVLAHSAVPAMHGPQAK